jgi:very-short-patch-repair endonuclease
VRDPERREWARDLRKNMGAMEWKLWVRLRNRQLGVRFKRQAPIGPYVVDFLCPAARLVVEVDGPHHSVETDGPRDRFLAERGYRVLRLRVTRFEDDTRWAIAQIASALDESDIEWRGRGVPD